MSDSGRHPRRVLLLLTFLTACLTWGHPAVPQDRREARPSAPVARPAAITAPKSDSTTARDLKLNGGFIQYWNRMMEWDWSTPSQPTTLPYPINWQLIAEKMGEAGMNIIVIQQLEYKQEGDVEPAKFYSVTDAPPFLPKADDPTEKILGVADKWDRAEVFLGLIDDKDWNFETPQKSVKEFEAYLLDGKRGVAARSVALAERVWALYRGRHRSFKGWYIPIEMWNFYLDKNDLKVRKKKIELLRTFLRTVSDRLVALDKKDGVRRRVAIAPYFNPTEGHDLLAPPDVTEAIYAELLNGAGVDVLMLQDGVGARDLDPNSDALRAYFNAFRNACGKVKGRKVEFWADTEIYKSRTRPVGIETLKKQLAVESEYAEKFVAWDFYQYMNPVVDDCCWDEQGNQVACKTEDDVRLICQNRNNEEIINTMLEDRRTFYNAYKSAFVDRPFKAVP